MQLVCLNVWGGKRFEPLAAFLQELSGTTDFFCFQEVLTAKQALTPTTPLGDRVNLLQELAELLPEFGYSFYPKYLGFDLVGNAALGVEWGSAIFAKKSLPSLERGGLFVLGSPSKFSDDHDRRTGILQYEKFHVGGSVLTLCNVYGMSIWPKVDTPDRLEQSKNMLRFIHGLTGYKLLCGDFNLFPDTESVAMLGRTLRNTVAEFGIATTRSEINRQTYKGQAIIDTISDYIFSSPDLQVTSLVVPELQISDHLPLILNFSLPA